MRLTLIHLGPFLRTRTLSEIFPQITAQTIAPGIHMNCLPYRNALRY